MDSPTHEISFASNPDFELRFQQSRTCKYRIYHPEFTAGLVVYIPGFGGDLGEYTAVFCQKVAARYQLAALSVEYFCINARTEVGAQIELEEADLLNLKAYLPDCEDGEYTQKIIEFAEAHNLQIDLRASLKPKRGEYQNFGILAALDILNAIKDAVDRYGLAVNNIILVGSSYGGYLANLVTKIFPGYVRAVFDNSSWAMPELAYIVGREINASECRVKLSPRVILHLFVKSPWTLMSGLPHSFDADKLAIRSFSADQISYMAAQGAINTCYYFYHSCRDTTAPTTEKITMVESMQASGFRYVFLRIVAENEVDGVFIKTLAHGMDLSMLTFFERAYQHLTSLQVTFTANTAKLFRYPLQKCTYGFDTRESPIAATVEAAE